MGIAKEIVAESIHAALPELDLREIADLIEVPPSQDLGDYSFPCFSLAKRFRKSPVQIASDIAGKIPENKLFDQVNVVNGFVNFTLNQSELASMLLPKVIKEHRDYGKNSEGVGKTVVIDFSSPNIAKAFSVAHLRSTVIGHSLARIWEHMGYNVEKVNHLGDWGTQFGKVIVAYRRWGDEPSQHLKGSIRHLLELYVRFHKEAEVEPTLDDEARLWFKKLEDGDPEAYALWEEFRKTSLDNLQEVYELMGITFDHYTGESFYNDLIPATIEKLEPMMEVSEGADIVPLGDDMPPFLVRKSDGATLYGTRDVTAAIYRHETFNFAKCLYVVGDEQSLHFKQVFTVLKKLGYDWADNCEHVPFGLMRFGDMKLSTRQGNTIFLEDVLNKAIELTKSIIEEKNPNLEDKDAVARMVGVGAVIFNDLRNNRIKTINFEWDDLLNFQGDTGPYVQYTHARASSLLARAGEEINLNEVNLSLLKEEEEKVLITQLERFPDVVVLAARSNEPSTVARYVLGLARDFNKFYQVHRILDEDTDLKKARLTLVDAVRKTIDTALYLLGLESPEKM